MTKVYDTGSNGYPLIREVSDGIMYQEISCQGTTGASTAEIQNVVGVFDVVVMAHYVDASNDAIVLPDGLGVGTPDIYIRKIEILADGPAGSSISVFAAASNSFEDGSASISIPCGQQKTFRVFNYPRKWGYC